MTTQQRQRRRKRRKQARARERRRARKDYGNWMMVQQGWVRPQVFFDDVATFKGIDHGVETELPCDDNAACAR